MDALAARAVARARAAGVIGGTSGTSMTGAVGAEKTLSPARRARRLIDGLDAQREAGEIGRHPEARAVGALECQIAARQDDDVFEHTRAGIPFNLPDVGDLAGDRAGRIVGSDTPAIDTLQHWPSSTVGV